MPMPERGRAVDEVIADLQAKRASDVPLGGRADLRHGAELWRDDRRLSIFAGPLSPTRTEQPAQGA